MTVSTVFCVPNYLIQSMDQPDQIGHSRITVNAWKQGSILMAIWAIATAQPASSADPQDLLARVTAKLAMTETRIPNFTCVETVTRDYYQPGEARPRACSVLLEERKRRTKDLILRHLATDRLRLDVTMVRTGELFSWVGASNFDDKGIDHLIHNGPIGTGAYGMFLKLVFLQDVKEFVFERNLVSGGRNLMEYSFRVNRSDSHYRVKLDKSWVYTAYSGTFQVDPKTDEVVRMNLQEEDLPDAADYCTTITSLKFHTAQIANVKFVMSASAVQRFVYGSGEEIENTTTFANCREYLGESTISFSQDSEPAQASTKKRGKPEQLPSVPAGLRFAFALTSPIETDTAAAGDPFAGKLAEPLLDGKHKVFAQMGSLVEGRLLRVQSSPFPREEVILILKPETVEINGAKGHWRPCGTFRPRARGKSFCRSRVRNTPEFSCSRENTSR
jgi:hypothetical protein